MKGGARKGAGRKPTGKTPKPEPIKISLANTNGIATGQGLRIGSDSYTIIKIDQSEITAVKRKRPFPAGTEFLNLETS